MNINMLNSAERETLLLEVLTVLKTSIPNITRPGSVLINQAQMMREEPAQLFEGIDPGPDASYVERPFRNLRAAQIKTHRITCLFQTLPVG